MPEYDVIVVGAGSAGLNTAINCAKAGLSVAALEEHNKIGFPRHCSGLYSTRFLSLMEVKEDFYEHEVFGAKFHPPSGKIIELMRKEKVAFVINRELLDDFLGKRAKECGVNIISNSKVSDFTADPNGATITTDKKTLTTKFICGADGSNSFIARSLGFKPPHRLHGIMAITKDEGHSNYVDLYFDNKLYPGFFAWRIPRGKTTEYGIAGETGPANVNNFNNFLAKFDVKKYELSSGVIPFGFQKSYSDRVLLVGDAAAQVKPLTGGGVIYGMICARIAARVFSDAISKNRFDEKFMAKYQKLWRSAIGKGIARGLLIRKIYSRMSNRSIDAWFSLLNNRVTKNIFENHGDMEFILERRPHATVLNQPSL
ncbi:MAG: NAD(P)/FAD-dependent oxidoreductase [Candidatus Aenigmarchaeota archaeon]|nr:NAD(P)/FAD-dependent oxidoreductase [Candidatus Aenigmarchaeota archaeon]